ncbi:MAG TPA: Gfo/Idh/MocA family oxidoreductase [Verrucomicrobiae bacterium]
MSQFSRRQFLRSTSAIAASTFFIPRLSGTESANEKLNVAVIGVANQGEYNLKNVASQNIVALCDVDAKLLAKAAEKFPQAKKFSDFRRLIDEKDIDAIVIATPDHTHAVATMAALQSGRHVYCEKPLTHTISECRAIREMAKKAKKATQMGTQIHAGDNYRRVVELIEKKAIGTVQEVHVWVSGGYGGKTPLTDTPPVPDGLDYNLWLGPVKERPYHPNYLPFHWRNWWAFGGGTLADIGCHYMDLPHWALKITTPATVEVEGPAPDPESPPTWLIAKYHYDQYKKDGVDLTWYHGGKRPDRLKLPAEQMEKWKSGILFVGDKGELLADYSRHLLLPEEQFKDYKRPEPFIKKSVGHHNEWIQACKTGSATTCNFDYSGALTEAVLLGNVAFRTGKKIEWDAKNLKAKNAPEADEFIQHHYRQGWRL